MGKTMRKGPNGQRVRENTRRQLREERTEQSPAYLEASVDLVQTEPCELAADFSLFLATGRA